MIDNLGNVSVKHITIKNEDIEKVKELLNKENIKYNEYENVHEILCDQEAKHAVEMMIKDNPDINFNKNTKKIVEESVFDQFKKSIDLENGMYDNEYIYEIKQNTIENIKKIIMVRDATDQLSKEYNIKK